MTKLEFTELIVHELTGGNVSFDTMAKYDQRVLEKRISAYFDVAMLNIFLQQKASNDFSSFDTWVKFYKDVAVAYDTERNEYYSDIPACLSSIPTKIAIREVRSMKNPDGAMPIMEAGANNIFAHLNLGTPEAMCYVDGNRIYYSNYTGFTKVGMRLVVSYDSYDDTDQIPMPISFKGTIFDQLVSSLRGLQQTPIDKVANNE